MRTPPPETRRAAQKTNPSRRPRSRPWRLRIALAGLVVLASAVTLALVLKDRGQPNPENTNPEKSTAVSTAAPTAATAGNSALPTIAPKTDLGSRTNPIAADLAARIEISLPVSFKKDGWELVHILPDGRLILNSGRRLSIISPADGKETVVKEAEFGIQAAANDRFLAFGVGGDEMTEIYLHQIELNYTEMVLQDDDGFLDLEMTRAGGLLVSRIRYTGEEAILDAWIRFDTASYKVVNLASSDRSYARFLFRTQYPSKNADWTYDIGRAWHQAWLDSAEQLFYAEIVRSGRNNYATKIYRSLASGNDVLLFESASGLIPDVAVAHNLLVIGRSTAYRTDTGRWLHASFETMANAVFPYGGRLLAAREDGILIAALDRFGRPSTLYRLPPAG